MEIVLGIIAIGVSAIALYISIRSDQRMKDLANLEFDEKLAVMASHSERIKTNRSLGSICNICSTVPVEKHVPTGITCNLAMDIYTKKMHCIYL